MHRGDVAWRFGMTVGKQGLCFGPMAMPQPDVPDAAAIGAVLAEVAAFGQATGAREGRPDAGFGDGARGQRRGAYLQARLSHARSWHAPCLSPSLAISREGT